MHPSSLYSSSVDKMLGSSVLSCSTSFSPPLSTSNSLHVKAISKTHCKTSVPPSFWKKLPSRHRLSSPLVLPPLHSAVTDEVVQTSPDESKLVEIGYICNVFGLDGELRVKPNTDFPELRFEEPGRRWLKERILGKEIIREIELVEGRDHPGQKSWIVSFRGIDTVEQAKQLVGSTLLVSEDEKPELEEGEFYTWELVGMKVILKDTGQSVGTVVNVFNSGASDLLQVMLIPKEETHNGIGLSKSGVDVTGPLVWIPFAEAIVPDVDMKKREMHITPPKGLLELNLRSDERSKKERRKLEWQERKKGTRRLIAAKKKLSEMDQKHIFHGLRYGEKSQKSLLADHIVGINLKLFQQAMQNFEKVPMRWNMSKLINANSANILRIPSRISEDSLGHCENKDKADGTEEFKQNGLCKMSDGKVAIILVVDGKTNHQESNSGLEHDYSGSSGNVFEKSLLQALLHDDRRPIKAVEEDIGLLPLVVVSPAHEIQSIQKLFLDHDYFAFDSQKVWFLEEENLPIVSSGGEQTEHKILMKSPWEILQSPVGSGGIFSLLSSHNVLENLSEMGIEYVQVCSLGERSVIGHPLFFGFVSSCKADIGIKLFNSCEDFEEDYDVIFSMKFLKKLTKETDKLQFHAIAKQISHVEMVNKEWVNVVPTSPNSYNLHCSIYSSLNACSPDKICAMETAN